MNHRTQPRRAHPDAHRRSRRARRHRRGRRRHRHRACSRWCPTSPTSTPSSASSAPMAEARVGRCRSRWPTSIDEHRWPRLLELLDEANADGVPMRGQAAARAIGILLGLQCTLNPFLGNPVMARDRRAAAGRAGPGHGRPGVQGAGARARGPRAGDARRVGPHVRAGRPAGLRARPVHEPRRPRRAGGARPGRAGLRPRRQPTRAARSSTCRSSTGSTATSTPCGEMLAHEHTVPGLSDGGAHVGTICDASFPTTLLSLWGRDRAEGRLPLAVPRAAARRATRPAPSGCSTGACWRPATAATATSSTSTRSRPAAPRCTTTCPPAAGACSSGPTATSPRSKRGQVTYERGEATEALPGRLVRGGQPAPT